MTVHLTVENFFSNAQLQKAIFSFNFGSGQSLKCLNQQYQSFDLWVKTQHLFGKKLSQSVFKVEYFRDIVKNHSKSDVL